MADDVRRSGNRTIAIVGPFGSGKTSLLEAMLARCGAIPKPGAVTNGSSVGDSSPEARLHGMSVEVNIADATFMQDAYTFLDCPGSVEFVYESVPVTAAVDAAIVVAEPDEKKIPALQVVMRELESRNIPRMLFLNKIDKATMGVRQVLEILQPASQKPLVLRQLPIWNDNIATGFIDLALDRAFVYREHMASEIIDIGDDDALRRDEARFSMLEALADHDDELMEQLLEDIEPPKDKVFGDLAGEMRGGLIVPVFIGSATNGNGILRLLKALRHDAPDIADTRERLGLDKTHGAIAQVLKTIHTTHAGKLSVVRVLSGSVEEGQELFDAEGAVGKASGVFNLLGQKSEKRGTAALGETVALGKLDRAVTGTTLGVNGTPGLVVPVPPAPRPVLQKVVRALERKDEVKLSTAIARLAEDDPSMSIDQRPETGETLLGGQGEMHLRVAMERLTERQNLKLDVRPATIPYRETIRGKAEARGRHKKQSGGHGQFGDVVIEVTPLARGGGFQFSDTISGGVVPKQYIPAVEAGVKEALTTGPLGGFPVVDLSVVLTDGSYHSVDSSEQAFKMAGIHAIREALSQTKPVLLEPIMKVVLVAPNEATAKVNAIVSGRRGQLLGYDSREGWPGWDRIEALMPEQEIADLIIELRSATAGVGSYSAVFDHMAEVNGRLADDILTEAGRKAA